MALSEDEQMLLKQIEESLLTDDPRLMRNFSAPMGAPLVRGRFAVAGIVAVVVSIIVLVAGGVVAGLPVVGVLSFIGMLAGAYLVYVAVAPWREARANPLHRER